MRKVAIANVITTLCPKTMEVTNLQQLALSKMIIFTLASKTHFLILAFRAELDWIFFLGAFFVLGTCLDGASFRIAFDQNWAVAFANHDHLLLTRGTSFDGRAWCSLARRLAAFAIIFVNRDTFAFWTSDLVHRRASLLLASPMFAAAVGLFDEIMAGFVARRRRLLRARTQDL